MPLGRPSFRARSTLPVPGSVTINKAASQIDPTFAGPIVFTVAFSEAVTGFTEADVDLSTSTVGGNLIATVSGSDADYTISITGMHGAGATFRSEGPGT